MELYEIVMRLVGPIHPTGNHSVDIERLENLKELTSLVDDLLRDIESISSSSYCHEESMKNIGEHAQDFMNEVKGKEFL